MKKYLILTILLFALLLIVRPVFSQENLAQKLSGRILLQVQSHGEAYYINPADLKRYYLNRPQDAFDIMRRLSIGITNKDLNRIPIAGESNYVLEDNFVEKNLGKLFLQIESAGECWYANPLDKKRYYLGRPSDAFNIMHRFSLGITNQNLDKIPTGYLTQTCLSCQPNNNPPSTTDETATVIEQASKAIRSGDLSQAQNYFTANFQTVLKYTLNFLNSEGKLALANILAGSTVTSSTPSEKIYSDYVYFNGDKIKVDFHLKKQPDGKWLIANL